MRKKAWRKNIAFLLVIAMMLTIMPVTVFAEGEEDGVETNAGTAMLYGSDGEVLESLSPAEEAQAVIAKWETKAQATTVYVSWNVGDTDKQEVEYTEDAYISSQNIVVTEVMGTVIATFSTENGTELAVASCNVVKAEEPERENVAQIGEMQYETLDKAIAAAEDGDTIELLADCTTEGLNLSKNLTISGAYTVTFTKYGIALWGNSLTFKDCTVIMNDVGSTPYTAEWNWMTICASRNASLTLDNVTMTMDGANAGNKHAIYFCSNNKLNLINCSSLTIKNYQQDALEWDGGDGGYNVNITDSTFISDHNRSGFTGTFYATIDNGTVEVINSTGNGSNGSHFIIKNNSIVNFSDNVDHGLSAGNLSVTNSTITANNNGRTGIIFTGKGNFENSVVTITGTKGISYWNAGMRLYTANSTAKIDKDCTFQITDNLVTGIFMDASSQLTIEEGANVLITRNHAEQKNCSIEQALARSGGGIVVRSGAVATLSNSTEIYNNHAALAGDDIYNEGTITFGAAGEGWALDGEPDCTDDIDGWYDDSADNRWEAHEEKIENNHVVKFPVAKEESAVVTTKQALKAAHGFIVDPEEVKPIVPMDWETSKSKVATNLDRNYQSKVTLSLPSAEKQLVSDVVFVLDKSTSADLEQQALDMLKNLKKQIENTNAKVNVGVVIFNKVANVTEFKDLATEYDAIEAAIKQDISSGTNTHAGLLAGKAMLDADKSVDSDRKYLIFVSDGITYMYNAEPTATAWTFLADVPVNWAGPDNWKSKYGTNEAPEDWTSWLGTIKAEVNKQSTQYEYSYGGTPVNSTPLAGSSIYANSIDKALYLTYEEYQNAVEAGYHCYAMTAETNGNHPWGPSFMNYLANGEKVDFTTIQNDIYYLLDAGSYVEDYMGYVDGEDGYNFDFINDAAAMTLKVGDAEYKAKKVGENKYSFNEDAYIVEYFPGEEDTEHFVWTINVPVSNFAPVQLTYTVQLMNPQTKAGTYGAYDADGSNRKAGLYTNNSATLYPVDSNGNEGKTEEFEKPTVAYTVTGSTPEIPGDGGDDTWIPSDPTPTNPPIEIPDTDVPLTEPEVPPVVIEDPDVPLVDAPGEPVVEIEEPEVPLGDAPKTGDTAPMVAFAGLMAAAVVGLVITRRKFN